MNRVGRAALLVSIGVSLGRLLWSGGFGSFVQQRMFWPLAVATAIVLVFGVYEAVAGTRDEVDQASQTRSVGPVVGWLLILPIVVLISIAPAALGAAAADRVEAYTPEETSAVEEQPLNLDDTDGPVELRVFDFLQLAVWDETRALDGVTVKLEGLVVNDPAVPDGFKLTRFMVSCCAADGLPLQINLHGVDQTFNDDTWVVAELTWREPKIPYGEMPEGPLVSADAIRVTAVDTPSNPYESPY